MRIHVQLFDDNDLLVAEGDANLGLASATKGTQKPFAQGAPKRARGADIDFSLPERAFFKKYSSSLSGPKQFVLMLAYLSQGKVGHEVALSEIKNRWSKMTSILQNDFNPSFTNAAKEGGWVDVKKRGIYVLHSKWSEILG
jgi:hypothetical protein